MDEPDQVRLSLIEYLATIIRPGYSLSTVDDDQNLIDSGIIDSLSVIRIIAYLETDHGVNLADSGVDPGTLVSIAGILDAIARKA